MSLMGKCCCGGDSCESWSCNCSTCSPTIPSSVSVTFPTFTLYQASVVWCCGSTYPISQTITNPTLVLNKCTCTSTEAVYWGSQLIHTGYEYEGSVGSSCDNSLCACCKTVNEIKYYLVSRLFFNCGNTPCENVWWLQSYVLKVKRYSHDVSCGSRVDCSTAYPYCPYQPAPTGYPFDFSCSVDNSLAAVTEWANTTHDGFPNGQFNVDCGASSCVPNNLYRYNTVCNPLGEYCDPPAVPNTDACTSNSVVVT